MRLQLIRLSACATLLAILLATELNAQTTTSGGLTGIVTDQSHAVIPDADVHIKNTDKGILQATTTDQQGAYHFFFVAPGKYKLTVSHHDFRPVNREVTVLLGPSVCVNLTLEVAKTTISVEVTAEAPLIHADNGDVSSTMSSRQISEVPNPGTI